MSTNEDQIKELLEMFSAEQLEALAALKKQETEEAPAKPKRKQQRKKGTPDIEVVNHPTKRKQRRKKIQTAEEHSGIPKKGNPAKRTQLEVGKKTNNFIASPEFNSDQDLIKEDQSLWKGKTPTPRMQQSRNFIDATCSRCNTEYENVSSRECYKDPDLGNVFVCESCLESIGGN